MTEPCCKGVLLLPAVAAVRGAIKAERIRREEVEARLEAEDLMYLDEKVSPTSWYPVGSLGRYLDITVRLAGGPSEAVHRKLGEIAADSTRASGMYQQHEFEEGTLSDWSSADIKRFSRLLATIWRAFYNFSDWRISVEEEERPGGAKSTVARVDWEGVGPLSNALCPITAGFTKRLFDRAVGSEVLIEHQLVSDDVFRYEIWRV